MKDTGTGIPPDRLDRLFKSFSQIDPSTSRRYGGTGLGLAISRLLAERLGGRIRVQSELAKGSQFSFTIQGPAGSVAEGIRPAEAIETGVEPPEERWRLATRCE